MSKPFDYSKWDKIELSDDEDDVHPNIDKESWFRMKHRSRVEREENEDKDKARIQKEMDLANQRLKVLKHNLKKIEKDQEDDSDEEDLDDKEGILAEIAEIEHENQKRQQALDQYEKNKKWNVDNMFTVKDERTVVNIKAAKENYTETGYAEPSKDLKPMSAFKAEKEAETKTVSDETKPKSTTDSKPAATATPAPAPVPTKVPPKPVPTASPPPATVPKTSDLGTFDTYHDFTEKYADTVEMFMKLPTLEESKEFLLKHGDILLQENASNYLLLASLEDEMNGYHEKMKRVARQSQIVTNIAELAKTMKTHPGNVIMPFFQRLQQREYLEEFMLGVNAFVDKIIKRAIVKKKEIDEERAREDGNVRDLEEIPREERLGPGGLDPLEVIKTLPPDLVAAFESRDVDQLKEALMKLEPEQAEYHMKRCVDSGLWQMNG